MDRIHEIVSHWAATAPDSVALVEDDAPVTFAALARAVDEAAEGLRAAGVRAGDRVMLVAENCVAAIACLFAASHLRAWPVIVNARLAAREIDAIRDHCEPRCLLFTAAVSADAAAHAARSEAAPAWAGLRLACSPSGAASRGGAEGDEVAALIYTSGTTGQPKGVMVSHRGLLHFAGISSASRGLSPADRAYGVLPLSHIFGLATMLLATLYAGASLYLRTRFTPEDAVRALADQGISMLQGVPMMFTRLLAHVRSGEITVAAPRLRYIYTGGAPLDPQLKRDVEALFGMPLHHGYGLTEYAGSLFITRADAPRSDTSAGYIVAGAELRLVDAEGRLTPPGETGEVLIRGPGLMLGYYRDPALTARVMRPGGWYATGDLGRLDADGALFLVGRTRDLIIRSGFNVYPIEVEGVIGTHPAVKQAAVVGRPAGDGNEEVVAFVELKPGCPFDAATLHAYLREQLAPYKRPSEIILIDALPTTASGKLLKQPLREMLAAR